MAQESSTDDVYFKDILYEALLVLLSSGENRPLAVTALRLVFGCGPPTPCFGVGGSFPDDKASRSGFDHLLFDLSYVPFFSSSALTSWRAAAYLF